MRIRTIKPEFWSSAKMARVPREVRLVFIGLWNEADDDGRLLGSPKRLAGSLFEHDADVDGAVMDAWLTQLEQAQLIVRYEAKGTAYVAIPGFGEHQRIDKRWASRLPAPPGALARPRASLAQQPASLPQLCAPDMSSSGNVFLPEMTSFGEGNTAPPKTLALAPVVVPTIEPEPEDDPQPTAMERLEHRESEIVIRSGKRSAIASKSAAASALFGRPQSARELLALRVVEDADGRIAMAPDGVAGVVLRDLWVQRYKALDGRGEPRRSTIAEVVERLWDHSIAKPWQTDGAGWGTRYFAWWSGHLGTDAQRVRQAWERDGGTQASDPERGAAKRRYVELQGLQRDLPPFETWFEQWKRGATETSSPSSPPGSGARPSGPRSGASPVHAADVMQRDLQAIEARGEGGAGGIAAMKAAQAKRPRVVVDDADIGSEVQS